MNRRAACAAVALAVLLLSRGAAGDNVRFPSGAACTTPAGSKVDLTPRSVVLDEAAWAKGDAETRRLQAAETRLKAENADLRASAAKGGGPFWANVLVLSVAFAAGAGVARLF